MYQIGRTYLLPLPYGSAVSILVSASQFLGSLGSNGNIDEEARWEVIAAVLHAVRSIIAASMLHWCCMAGHVCIAAGKGDDPPCVFSLK